MPRPRSNALTGPSDPRYRSVAEIDLYSQLNMPNDMDESLRSFLQKVYQKKDLMAGPDRLADKLYDLYSGDGAEGGQGRSSKECKAFFLTVWAAVKADDVLQNAALQYTEVSLADLVDVIKQGGKPESKYYSDFIYFSIGQSGAAFRVYANAKYDYAPQVVAWLKKYMDGTNAHGITSFKLAGPAVIDERKDSIVIYCDSKRAAQAVAAKIIKLPGHFNIGIPALTTPEQGGVGVSLGAEPVWQATGLGVKPKGYPETAQSFGSIRCELIAAAILNFSVNKDQFGDTFEMFSKFVAVAFRGYGLDPLRPGD